MGKIINKIKNPKDLFLSLGHRGFLNWMTDKTYIKIAHKIRLNEKINLKQPETYNQKLQWLKLYHRDPLYTKLVDKLEVRKYVSEIIGEDYLIPLIDTWKRVDEIDFNSLPNDFVLKCTHDSGGLVICRNKNKLDIKKTKEKLEKSLHQNYYWGQREWPYKNVSPMIIAEKYMEDNKTKELRDYKFFCFNGEVKAMFVATDRNNNTKFDFFDSDFNHLPVKQFYPNSTKKIEKPKLFEKMKKIASKLSQGIPHVRVDLYEINGQIYFGEMTFFHFSGWERFEPASYDKLFGSWLELPQNKKD